MPRKFFRKFLPDAAQVRSHRVVRLFGSLLHHPNLWHLNRESVAGGVAIGLFAGLVPGPLQMLTAALLAVPLHRNLPVALVMTLYTNPFTIVPLYVLAYEYGKLLLGVRRRRAEPAAGAANGRSSRRRCTPSPNGRFRSASLSPWAWSRSPARSRRWAISAFTSPGGPTSCSPGAPAAGRAHRKTRT